MASEKPNLVPIRQTCQWLDGSGQEARSAVNICTPRYGRCLSHSPPNPFLLSLLPWPSRRDASQHAARCSRGMPASAAAAAEDTPSRRRARPAATEHKVAGGKVDDPMRWHECVHGSLCLDLDECRQYVRAGLVFPGIFDFEFWGGHGHRRHPGRLCCRIPFSSNLP